MAATRGRLSEVDSAIIEFREFLSHHSFRFCATFFQICANSG
jgi:hypothetical protein